LIPPYTTAADLQLLDSSQRFAVISDLVPCTSHTLTLPPFRAASYTTNGLQVGGYVADMHPPLPGRITLERHCDRRLKTPLKDWLKEWYQGANRRFASKYCQMVTIALEFVNKYDSNEAHLPAASLEAEFGRTHC